MTKDQREMIVLTAATTAAVIEAMNGPRRRHPIDVASEWLSQQLDYDDGAEEEK